MKYIIKDKTPICTPSSAVAVFKSLLDAEDKIDREKEHLWVMHLSNRHIIKCVELVSLGIVDRALIAPREVFIRAVRECSTSLILCHNHPSDDSKPSEEDLAVTRSLIKAGELFQIPILDHLIITTDGKHTSLKEWGLVEFLSSKS